MNKGNLITKMQDKFFSNCEIACPQKKMRFFSFLAIFGDFFMQCYCHFSFSFDSVNKISHFLESRCPEPYVEIQIFIDSVFFARK